MYLCSYEYISIATNLSEKGISINIMRKVSINANIMRKVSINAWA